MPNNLLQIAQLYFQEFVAPQAEKIDKDSQALAIALKGMGDRNLLALRVSQNWGGAGLTTQEFRLFQETIARYSGALAFLQTQHQSAAYRLMKSGNELLKQKYLPHTAKGKVLLGIGFSHVRRPGEPIAKAFPVPGGYRLEGKIPWLTGFEFFHHFIIGATLPDGQVVYAMMPFQHREEKEGKISFSPPQKLAAMNSTNTVSANLKNCFLPQEQVLFLEPVGTIHQRDKSNVLQQAFYNLGCARAGLDIIAESYHKKQLIFIKEAFIDLEQELNKLREKLLEADGNSDIPFEQKLILRAKAISLASRCAQGSVAVSSGTANYENHPAQRVYREALLFAVSSQTTNVMEATLANLIR